MLSNTVMSDSLKTVRICVVWDKSYESWCIKHRRDPVDYTKKFMNKVERVLECDLKGIDFIIDIKGCVWNNEGSKDLLADLANDFTGTSESLKVLGLTNKYNEHNGIAQLNGGHCMIDPQPRQYLWDWPEANIAVHEICHTLGAKDHYNRTRCVMNKSIPFFWTAGAFNLKLCNNCKSDIIYKLIPKAEGKHIVLKVKEKDFKVLKEPNAWIDKLDRAYEAYADLVGSVPYNGKKIVIESVSEYPGGWAVAGNPIKWHEPYIADAFKQINEGDWLFGILHEMGHDFDLDYRWVWEAEFFANLKMVYVAEQLHAKIKQANKWYDYTNLNGLTLDDYYAERASLAGEEKLLRDWWHHNDSSVDKFLKIKNRIGWQPFKLTFREYQKLAPIDIPKTAIGKFNLFVHYLGQFADQDLSQYFIDWGYPVITIKDGEYLLQLNKLNWDIILQNRYVGTEGKPLELTAYVVKDTSYKMGLGTHANSEIIYQLDGAYDTFEADIGVDNEVGKMGTITFEVWIDGHKSYESGLMYGAGPAKHIKIAVNDAKQLRLIVTDGCDNIDYDHADWANARLMKPDGTIVYLSELTPIKARQDWGKLGINKSVDNHQLSLRSLSTVPTTIRIKLDDSEATLEDTNHDGIYRGKFESLATGEHVIRVIAERGPYIIHKMSFAYINPPNTVYLSDLTPVKVKNGMERDMSCQKYLMRIGGKKYKRGIGVHANSEIIYKLNGVYDIFEAVVGVDDETNGKGSVVFKVYVDDKLAFKSGKMRGGEPTKKVKVSVKGAHNLKLVVTDAGDGTSYDHADWVAAKLIKY